MVAGLCPHCGASNAETASFCGQCGKAVPLATDGVVHTVPGDAIPITDIGREIQADRLQKKARQAVAALAAVALIQALAGVVFYVLLRQNPNVHPKAAQAILVRLLVVGGIFGGLAFWARRSPLPAAIVGLALCVTLLAIDFMANLATVLQGFIIKILIIAVLVKILIIAVLVAAVRAGIRCRQIIKAGAANPGGGDVELPRPDRGV